MTTMILDELSELIAIAEECRAATAKTKKRKKTREHVNVAP